MTPITGARDIIAALSIVLLTASFQPALAVDAPAAAPVSASHFSATGTEQVSATGAQNADPEAEGERKRKLRLAILTGGLIAVTGLALVILTILGGSATRRGLRRKPLLGPPPTLEPIPSERFDESDRPAQDQNPAGAHDAPPRVDGGAG